MGKRRDICRGLRTRGGETEMWVQKQDHWTIQRGATSFWFHSSYCYAWQCQNSPRANLLMSKGWNEKLSWFYFRLYLQMPLHLLSSTLILYSSLYYICYTLQFSLFLTESSLESFTSPAKTLVSHLEQYVLLDMWPSTLERNCPLS